jgi:alkylation response protein AidB-like acyl-CoA dehydrogenase
MDLLPTPEQAEIAQTVAAFLADRLPVVASVGRLNDEPELVAETWRECAALGWLSLGLPETLGGVGYGLAEEMLLFRELGRGLAPGAFLPTALGLRVAARSGCTDITDGILDGRVRVALATPHAPLESGTGVSGEFTLTHFHDADYALICEPTRSVLVSTASFTTTTLDAVDRSVSIGRGHAVDAPIVASVDAAEDPVHDRAMVLTAAIGVGIAEATRDLAVGYAKTRQQFGKPIGVNQAVKHACADMAVRADGAFAQATYAALVVDGCLDGRATEAAMKAATEAAMEAAIAKHAADDAARRNAAACVQIHGGIGFTSEHSPHRYVLRAHVNERLVASRTVLLDRILGSR